MMRRKNDLFAAKVRRLGTIFVARYRKQIHYEYRLSMAK